MNLCQDTFYCRWLVGSNLMFTFLAIFVTNLYFCWLVILIKVYLLQNIFAYSTHTHKGIAPLKFFRGRMSNVVQYQIYLLTGFRFKDQHDENVENMKYDAFLLYW